MNKGRVVLHMAKGKSIDFWIIGPVFDIIIFQITGLLCLLLIIPYKIWGAASVIPIYNFYLIFFGMPHNFLTWAHILPKNIRSSLNIALIRNSAFACFALCALIPWVRGLIIENWILSLITYASLWHAYRQHHGICKVYDAVQSQRTNDMTIFNDRKYLNIFLGLALHTVLVWAFTHSKIPFLLSSDAMYELVYVQVPWVIFKIYILITLIFGTLAIKQSVYDRIKNKKYVPWPQIGLIFSALLTYIIPYIFIPLEAIPVSVAIGTIFHNIQYIAFVYVAEKHRAHELVDKGASLHPWQRFISLGKYKTYLAISLAYSFFIIALYMMMPTNFALVMIYFVALAHYIIDGHIWKRENNTMMSPIIRRLAFRY